MEPNNNLLLILSPEGSPSLDPFSKTYSNLATGFYGVSFEYDPSGSAGSTFYQSNSYNCPTTETFTDKRGIFLPCAGQGQQAVHVDKVNLHLRQALKAHKCTGRTYYFEEECHPVSPTCNTFDPRSGWCLSCAVQGHKVQANGECRLPMPQNTNCQGNCVSDNC